MKELARSISSSIVVIILLTAQTTLAAYIIEASDAAGRLGEGNFAYTGAGGTAASYSTASAGQLPATTDPTPTFFSLRHAWGGNGTADEYTFTYSPLTDGDNTAFAENTIFNLPQNLRSTGLSGGDAGTYNVYRIHPGTPGVSGGLTTYSLFVNGALKTSESIDQNAANLTSGENIGRWELIGSVDLLNNTDTVTVTMTPDTSTYVSMRASGIMFEYVIPEPSVVALLGIGSVLMLIRRRLMI
ncbi:PEP-CTERM sorting domain-containing protein [Pontiellaceae bacterium B12227]|nr:PEP-CTERM sorting domain-containing protein [Pontiellaceae bacterium B12227]